eukprot:3091992-Prymnesium_polylepis.1
MADVGRFLRIFTELPQERITELESLQGASINRDPLSNPHSSPHSNPRPLSAHSNPRSRRARRSTRPRRSSPMRRRVCCTAPAASIRSERPPPPSSAERRAATHARAVGRLDPWTRRVAPRARTPAQKA